MKNCFLLAVIGIIVAACGGNTPPSGVANDVEAAKEGLLGSYGETIVQKVAEFNERAQNIKSELQEFDQEFEKYLEDHKDTPLDGMEKLKREMNEKFYSRKVELDNKWIAFEKEVVAWERTMKEQLKSVQIPTKLAEGSSLKLVEPFYVSRVDSKLRTLSVSATVEPTVNRPRFKDMMSYNKSKVRPTVSALDGEGRVLSELNGVNSRFDEKTLDLNAGEKIKIVYHLDFSMLGAKKLLIEWDASADAGKAVATSSTKNELGLFQLRGPVKKCVWNDGSETRTIEFDEKGMWTLLNGKTPWGGDMKVKRDSNNRIIKRGDAYDEEYTTYKYNAQGQLAEQTEMYMDGGCATKFTYNSDGDCTGKISCDPEGDVKITYTILERDDNNNWTKRKDQNGNSETRKIYYYY